MRFMQTAFAKRVLNLPSDYRVVLSQVEGPGRRILQDDRGVTSYPSHDPQNGTGPWWSANPAASVAAVFYPSGSPLHERGLYHAHELLRAALVNSNDDHEAALCLIEAHVIYRC